MFIYFDLSMFPEAMEKCAINSEIFPLSRNIVYFSADYNAVVFLNELDYATDWKILCDHPGFFIDYILYLLPDYHADMDKLYTGRDFSDWFNGYFTYVFLNRLFE